MLPSALDVRLENGSQEFSEYPADPNMMEVLISWGGTALISESTISALDESTIQDYVTEDRLSSYFRSVYPNLVAFDAVIGRAASEIVNAVQSEDSLQVDNNISTLEAILLTSAITTCLLVLLIAMAFVCSR